MERRGKTRNCAVLTQLHGQQQCKLVLTFKARSNSGSSRSPPTRGCPCDRRHLLGKCSLGAHLSGLAFTEIPGLGRFILPRDHARKKNKNHIVSRAGLLASSDSRLTQKLTRGDVTRSLEAGCPNERNQLFCTVTGPGRENSSAVLQFTCS